MSDSIKQPDYNISYNLSQNALNLSHKSKIVETEYSISISYWSGIQRYKDAKNLGATLAAKTMKP